MNLRLILLVGLVVGTGEANMLDRVQKSVVKIGLVSERGEGTCSGAFIDEKGTVLTCAHCFRHSTTKIFIKQSNGSVMSGTLVKLDAKRDLALVETDWTGTFYLHLGPKPKLQQLVFAFGSPLGLQGTVTSGLVENFITMEHKIIIHGAFINPGNSGGPLVDKHGQLVGINEATFMQNFLVP